MSTFQQANAPGETPITPTTQIVGETEIQQSSIMHDMHCRWHSSTVVSVIGTWTQTYMFVCMYV